MSPFNNAPPPPVTNWAVLAALRFFLAWVVLSGHVFWFTPNAGSVFRFFDSFGGKPAVLGFLMVSGYSIAASLRKDANGFYRRRIIRLYPLYFCSLILAVALQVVLKEVPTRIQVLHPSGSLTVLGNFLLLQMFLVKSIAYDPVVWSLSIEFSYYLLAPFLARLNTRTIFAMIVVSGLAYVAFKVGDSGFLLHAINKCNPLKYLWAWLLGFVCFRDQRPVVLVAVAVVGAPLVALANEDSLALVTFGLSYLLLNASGKLPSGHFQKNVMNYLGDLSYPMYLVHFPCFVICVFLVGISNVWIFVVLTLLATVLSYHLVDIYLKRIVFVPMINEVIRRWGSGLELIFSRGGVLNKPH